MTTQSATPPSVRYLSFSAFINRETVQTLIQMMSKYHNEGVQEVYLMMSTGGGEVQPGVHLYNFLRGLPFRLTIHNVGYVNSVGNVVFLAGDRRYANPNATFMFHGVGFTLSQGTRFEEQQLRERLEGVLRDQGRLGSIIHERTKLDEEVVKGLFSKAETMDAAWAAEHGLIDEIRDLQIPAGSRVDSLVVQQQKGTV